MTKNFGINIYTKMIPNDINTIIKINIWYLTRNTILKNDYVIIRRS